MTTRPPSADAWYGLVAVALQGLHPCQCDSIHASCLSLHTQDQVNVATVFPYLDCASILHTGNMGTYIYISDNSCALHDQEVQLKMHTCSSCLHIYVQVRLCEALSCPIAIVQTLYFTFIKLALLLHGPHVQMISNASDNGSCNAIPQVGCARVALNAIVLISYIILPIQICPVTLPCSTLLPHHHTSMTA